MQSRLIASFACACLLLGAAASAQTTAGSIAGSVLDPSGASVANAKVTATDAAKGYTLNAVTDASGRFVFPNAQPGNYTITVEAPGFKKYQQTNIPLQANESRTVGVLKLEVGSIQESIEVQAQGQQLQTESAERSESLTAKQISNIAINGRSYLPLVALLPGVATAPNLQTASHSGVGSISANGSRQNQNNLTLDGLGDVDTGNNGDQLATVSVDSVQEFRMLTSNYQAEYGRSAGSQISVVTKSGSNEFHGSAYIMHRNEGLNANNWLNNRDGLPRKLYRYNDPGFTLGGPVVIPHVFERWRNKVFFFTSHEWQNQLQPASLRRQTVPTALERQGNFSQSVDKSGTPFPYIRDYQAGLPCGPSNTAGCFQDGGVLGKIPASRLNPLGLAILNINPLPNAQSAANKGFNYETQISGSYPRREDDGRIDININDKNKLFTRYLYNFDAVTSPYGSFVLGTNIPITPITDARPGRSWVVNLTSNVSPTMVNEATWGFSKNVINIFATTGALTRSATGISALPMLYPSAIQDDYIPSFGFNGTRISGSGGFGTADAPFFNYNTTIEYIDNLSKVWNNHVFKVGFYAQRSRKDQTSFSDNNGHFEFGDDSSDPFDTGFGFANAATGVFTSFDQASHYLRGMYRYSNVEWYLQDDWKATSRLTLDYGLRFYYIQPQFDAGLQTSNFLPDHYNRAAAPRLYYPILINGKKYAIDRATGQTLPAYAIGDIVPDSGNLLNGIYQAGISMSKYLMKNPGITYGPRFGFAYDLTGHGNIVLRAGGGLFYDRYQGNIIFDEITNPPNTFQPTLTYGLINNLNAGNALFGPSNLHALDYSGKIPTTGNFSFGIQSKLPYQIVLDTAYVGARSWHLLNLINLNGIPYGTTFLPQNQDPTKAATNPKALLGSNAYSSQFVRPYPGYGDITYHGAGSSANYNSLQISASRQYARGLTLGIAYTYAKALGVTSGDGDYLRIDNLTRFADYGPLSFDVRHTAVFNYIYTFPSAFKHNAVLHALLDGWQISGLTKLQTGFPYEVGVSIPGYGNQNITGSYTEPMRIQVVGDPLKGTSDSPYNRLEASAFAPPQVGNIGLGEGRNPFYKPGINNTDLFLQKSFAFGESNRYQLELRLEAYNFANHAQFNGINSTVNFSGIKNPTVTNLYLGPNGTVNNINGFGTISGVNDPRIVALTAHFVF